jgi:hypothetical protein
LISVYAKNRQWSGHPRCDFILVISENPSRLKGFRINGGRLAQEPASNGYLAQFGGWYHPATAWEIEEFKRLGGSVGGTSPNT